MVFRSIVGSCLLACLVALGFASGTVRAQVTTTYTYDGAGRLRSAVDSTGATVAYQYDNAGNRTQVGNGVEPGEIVAVAYSASSTLTGSLAPSVVTMRDGLFDSRGSIAATATQSDAWIQADLGSVKYVATVKLAPANDPSLPVNAATTNGAVLEYSTNGTTWTTLSAVSSLIQGAYQGATLNAQAQYLRVHRVGSGQVALGDFRFYSTVDAGSDAFGIGAFQATTSANTAVSIPPLQDYQGAHTGLTITGIAVQPPNGSATANPDGKTIVYMPNTGFSGSDSFTYNVVDANGAPATPSVSVSVTPVSTSGSYPPYPFADYVTGVYGTAVTFNPIANDADPYGSTLQLVCAGATATVSADATSGSCGGTLPSGQTFTSNTSTGLVTWYTGTGVTFVGQEDVAYIVRAVQTGKMAVGVIHATVTVPPPPPPVAVNDAVTAPSRPITFNPRTNDSNAAAIDGVGIPSHGTASVNSGQTVTYAPEAGYLGPDSFTYQIDNGNGLTATATISVTVTPNHPPVAVNDAITAHGTTPLTFDPRVNDSDPDSDPLTLTAVSTPSHGTASFTGTSVTYAATSGYTGSDSFTYTISDGQGGTATATVNVTVGPAVTVTWNPADEANVTLSNSNLTATYAPSTNFGTVRATLSQATGKIHYEVTIVGASHPGEPNIGIANASASLTSWVGADNNSIEYQPDGHVWFNGGVVASLPGYTVGDVIAVEADFDNHLIYFQKAGGARSSGISFSAMSGPYFPVFGGGFSGDAATANFGATAWVVTPTSGYGSLIPNTPPVAANDAINPTAGVALTFDPRTNDSDPDGDPLTITAVSAPIHGSAATASGGTAISYTATTHYSGSDSFTYTISDGRGGTATATVSATVIAPANHAPVAVNDSITATSGVAKTFDPRTNDSDADGDPLTITAISAASHGTAAFGGSGTTVTYTATSGYTGSDSFTYSISDGQGGTAMATVNVTVTPPGVTWNPADQANVTLSNGNLTATYAPSTNYGTVRATLSQATGKIHFEVTIVGASHPGEPNIGVATSAASLTNWVGADNNSIEYQPDGHVWFNGGVVASLPGFVVGDVIAVEVDADNHLIYFQKAGGTRSSGISFSGMSGPYFPVFGGGFSGDAATANFGGSAWAVTPTSGYGSLTPNNPPTANNDAINATSGVTLTFDPRTNDVDPDGDPLTVTVITQPSHGAAAIAGGGVGISYTATAHYAGSDSFTYTISDGRGGTSTASVSAIVTAAANNPPVAANDAVSATTGVAKTFDPRVNDIDADGDPLTIMGVTVPNHGAVSFTGTSVTYTATSGYTGSDSFSYTISDGQGGTATGVVNVTVAAAVVVTWNPADKANVTLSNGNLTATYAPAASQGNVRATLSQTTGKTHFELTIVGAGSRGYPTFGIANASQSLTGDLGIDNNSIEYQTNGFVYRNNSIVATLPTFSTGDVIAVEVDFDNHLIYFQKAGGARSAGINFSSISGPYFAVFGGGASGDSVTANFGASAWVVTPTSGFGP